MAALVKFMTVLGLQARFLSQRQAHLRRTFRAQSAILLPTGSTPADSASLSWHKRITGLNRDVMLYLSLWPAEGTSRCGCSPRPHIDHRPTPMAGRFSSLIRSCARVNEIRQE